MGVEDNTSVYYIISTSRSFVSSRLKFFKKYRPNGRVQVLPDPSALPENLSRRDILLLDGRVWDGQQHHDANKYWLNNSNQKIHTLLFLDFRNPLPEYVNSTTGHVQVIARNVKHGELHFRLSSCENEKEIEPTATQNLGDRFSELLIKVQTILLSPGHRSERLAEVVPVLGQASQASSVLLFENHTDFSGSLYMSQVEQWHSKQSQYADSVIFNLMPYEPSFARWRKILASGGAITALVQELPASERPLLKSLGVHNLLLLPIMVREENWGYIMFLNDTELKRWNEKDIKLLRSMVVPLSSFFEIKDQERKRGASDRRLRKVFEKTNIGLALTTMQGKLQSFNPAFSEMLGYREEELQNLNINSFTHPNDLGVEKQQLENLQGGEIDHYQIEKRLLQKGGNVLWVRMNVSAYSRDKGKPESLISIIEDVTRQKDIERALAESEERYHKLSDLSLEGIVIHQQGVAIDCNERFLEMSEYSRDEIIGKNLVELLADEDSKVKVWEKIKKNDENPYEAVGITKSGQKSQVELENRMVEYAGQTMRVTAFRDITIRKKNEQEIRKLNTAIDQSPSSIVITDLQGKIEYVNRSFCQTTGYSAEEAIGKLPSILKTNYHKPSYYKTLWNTILAGKTWNGVFKNKTKDGTYYWEKAIISPIFDDSHTICNFLAIKENITGEKATQKALKESEKRHRMISELTNDFIYAATIKRQNLYFSWTNGTLKQLCGYTDEQIRRRPGGWHSIVHEQDLMDIVLPGLLNIQEKTSLNLEYRIITASGKIRWVYDKIKLIGRSKGEVSIIGAMRNITTRKEATVALTQSTNYLNSIINHLPLGLQIFDEQGFSQRVNRAEKTLLGIPSSLNESKKFNILNDPFAKALRLDKIYNQVYQKKETISHVVEIDFGAVENKWTSRNDKIYLNETIFPILNVRGDIRSVVALHDDITDQIKAQQALKESDKHQKNLLKAIPDLIFVLSEQGVFKDVYTENPEKLLFPREQFIGKKFSEIFEGDLKEKFYQHLSILLQTEEIQVYDYNFEIGEQAEFFETRLLLSADRDIIAIIRNITESASAERKLKESEEKFRELAERSQDALVLLNAENEVLYMSSNFDKITGIVQDDYIKSPEKAIQLIHKDDRDRVHQEIDQYRKNKEEYLDIQFRFLPDGKHQKWLWYRESCITDQAQNPLRYAVVITDVTAGKKVEEELKKAKEEAEKANNAKSAFLANVSHEIRTPMNAVLGFSELLYSRIEDPVLKGYLNSIKSSGNTLLNLLNDILDLSKIEANRMTITYTPVSLFDVFEEAKHIFSLRALQKGLDYSFVMDKKIPLYLQLDELRIKQILLNLIDNAIKFTEKGAVKVNASCPKRTHDGKSVDLLITVEDTGIGVPKNLQRHIFESFRQQDEQDKKKYQGTGLGLAITKRLVELFKGKISLRSTAGQGSIFKISLPGIRISEGSMPKKGSEIHEKIGYTEILDGKTILIVDADSANRKLIKELLSQYACKIIDTDSPDKLNVKTIPQIDLQIIGIGSSTSISSSLGKKSSIKRLEDVPKIGISSVADVDHDVMDRFDAFFTKPVPMIDLINQIIKLIQLQSGEEDKANQEKGEGVMSREELQKVVGLLENEWQIKWKETMKTSSFSKIEAFALEMKAVGATFELQEIQSFSDVLVMHAKNFDIDNMNGVLKTYPQIVNALKAKLNQLKN